MMTADDYRARVQDCRDKAHAATTEAEKSKWQELAEAWEQLLATGVLVPPPYPSAPSTRRQSAEDGQ